MRAAVLQGPGMLTIADRGNPYPGDAEIVVAVRSAGICGSDLVSYATGAYVQPGQVMGHEFAGEVVEVGRLVEGLAIGQRVAVRPLFECGSCAACANGLKHVCELGVRHAIGYGQPGAFADRVLVADAVVDSNVFLLDDSVTDSAGAMVEVFAVASHACRRLQPRGDSSCVVLGLGPVGLAAIQVLRAYGIRRIVGVDNSELRRRLALELGAAAATDQEGLRDVAPGVVGVGPRHAIAGADAVLEASGSQALLSVAPKLLKSGGRLGLVALYRRPAIVDVNAHVTREIDIVGCFGYGADFKLAASMINAHKVDPDAVVTRIYPLERIVEAFAAQSDAHRNAKVQIIP